jgi:hypothetical protein
MKTNENKRSDADMFQQNTSIYYLFVVLLLCLYTFLSNNPVKMLNLLAFDRSSRDKRLLFPFEKKW